MTEPELPTAGIPESAPRVFISYAQDDDAHKEQVRRLWALLRANHVDARIDGPAAEQPQDWPVWMTGQIRKAEYILVIASPAYRRRAEGEEEVGVGRGVAWEARHLREIAHRNPLDWYRRILGVVLPGRNGGDLPAFMTGGAVTLYEVPSLDGPGIEGLLRYLLGQPYETVVPLGPRPLLPARDTSAPASPAPEATPASAAPGPQGTAVRAQQHITSYGGIAVGTQDGNVYLHQAPLPATDTAAGPISAESEDGAP